MLAFIKRILGLTPKTPEQRALYQYETIEQMMREHYCIEVHQEYQDEIDRFACNEFGVDPETINGYTRDLQQYLDETSGLKRSLGF